MPSCRARCRHDRLEDESEGHRPARTIEQVLPDAVANLSREAVPDHAGHDKRDDQHDDQLRQAALTYPRRFYRHLDASILSVTLVASGFAHPADAEKLAFAFRLAFDKWGDGFMPSSGQVPT